MDAIVHYPFQFEQLQSFIKWNPKEVAPASSPVTPVKPNGLPSPAQSNQTTPHSPALVSLSEESPWPHHSPNAPMSLRVAASTTEANVKQQNEIDGLRTELERKRVEVHQLKMRWIEMCSGNMPQSLLVCARACVYFCLC